MFCENCGKSIPDGSRFCEHCGAPMSAEQPAATVSAPVAAPAAPAKPGIVEQVKALCKQHKWILPAVAAVVVIAIVVAVVLNIVGKRVSINKYLKVEATGFNEYGKFNYDLDMDSLLARMLGLKEYKEYGSLDPEKMSESEREAFAKQFSEKEMKLGTAFAASVKVNVEYPEGKSGSKLSNGDVIKLELVYDEKAADALGITVIDPTIEYTVEGLRELSSFDVLENFSFVAEGYNGDGKGMIVCTKSGTVTVGDLTFETDVEKNYIQYTTKEGYGDQLYLQVNKGLTGISNGDVITLSCGIKEDALASYGVKLTGLSKEVTVSGLKEYQNVNLLDHVKVNCTGLNGDGRAEVVVEPAIIEMEGVVFNFEEYRVYKNDERMGGISVYTSKSRSLSNGDVIKVTIEISESTLKKCGLKMTETEKEFTVSGLAEYADHVDDLKNIDDLVSAGMVIVNDFLNDDWGEAVHDSWRDYTDQYVGDDMVLYAKVLTTPKSTTSSTKNTLWLIYRVTLKDNTMEENTPYFFAVSQNNLAIYSDDSILETNTRKTKYNGFTSYSELVEKHIAAYNLNVFETILLEDTQPTETTPAETTPTEGTQPTEATQPAA